MKCILVSDTHLHAWTKSPVNEAGKNLRLLDSVQCLERARDLAIQHHACIIHCGDFFHDRKGITPEVLETSAHWLESLAPAGVELYVVVGNHDLSDGADGGSSVRVLSGYATVVDRPSVVSIQGTRFAFLPYVREAAKVQKYAERLSAKASILIAHLGLGDPRYADAVPSDYEAPGCINLGDLHADQYAQVFLGHYHNRQSITKNVHYVGSPLQHSVKEAGQERGFGIYDTDTNTLTWTVNDWSPQYVKTTVAEASLYLDQGTKNFLVVEGANPKEAADLTRLAEDAKVPIRIERTVPEASQARLPVGLSGEALLDAYVRAVVPDIHDDDVRELVGVGASLFIKTQESTP